MTRHDRPALCWGDSNAASRAGAERNTPDSASTRDRDARSTRASGIAFVLIVACTPAPTPPVPPEAPVLEVPPSDELSPFIGRTIPIRAIARDDTLVRLFVSRDCSGPELLRRRAADFASGVEVESVHGDNHFSALAVDGAGLTSDCSAPARVHVRLPMRGMTSAPQVLRIAPPIPTSQRRVNLQGSAPLGWTVRAWAGRECGGTLLASTDAATFRTRGLTVPLQPNKKNEVTLDAELNAVLTLCNGPVLELTNDEIAPEAPRARFFPPAPWPNPSKAVLIENLQDANFVSLTPMDCSISTLVPSRTFCGDNVCHTVVLPVTVSGADRWGLQLIDGAGNRSPCLTLSNAVDPMLEELPVYMETLPATSNVNLLAVSNRPGVIGFHVFASCTLGPYPAQTYLDPTCAVLVSQAPGRWAVSLDGDAGTCFAAP